jgi:hypothetical protein
LAYRKQFEMAGGLEERAPRSMKMLAAMLIAAD